MVSSCSWQEVFSLYIPQTLILKAATHFWRHKTSVLAPVTVARYFHMNIYAQRETTKHVTPKQKQHSDSWQSMVLYFQLKMEELEETEEEEDLVFLLLRRCANLQIYHQETTIISNRRRRNVSPLAAQPTRTHTKTIQFQAGKTVVCLCCSHVEN